MRKGWATIALYICIGMVMLSVPLDVRAEGTETEAFKDVNDSHWAKATIDEGVRKGYVTGYPDGTFRPSNSITRAEVASMLSRVTMLPPSASSGAFPDLDKHWSKEAVRKLVSLGMIKSGDYATGFEPDKAITRFELMKWMASGLSMSEPSMKQALADTKETLLPTPESFKGGISKEQVPYIALVRGTGVVNGFPDGSFKPREKATRAEVLTMMLRYAQVEGTKAEGYRDLSEMRAVGVEKTNVEVITSYHFLNDDYKFTNIAEKKLTFPDMDVVIHKMIAVDLTTDAQVGLYAPLFVGKERKPYQKGYYLFFESTITMKTDKYNPLKLAGEINKNNNIYHFQRVDDDVSKRLGLKVVPGDDPGKYMTKGTPRKVWSVKGISAGNGSRSIITNDETKVILYEGS